MRVTLPLPQSTILLTNRPSGIRRSSNPLLTREGVHHQKCSHQGISATGVVHPLHESRGDMVQGTGALCSKEENVQLEDDIQGMLAELTQLHPPHHYYWSWAAASQSHPRYWHHLAREDTLTHPQHTCYIWHSALPLSPIDAATLSPWD